jgi:iron(III) transport system permease protein
LTSGSGAAPLQPAGWPHRILRRLGPVPGLLLLLLLITALLGVFIVWPLVISAVTPDAAAGAKLLGSSRLRQITLQTLWLTALSTVSAITLGLLFALAVTRFRIPGRQLFAWIPLLGLFSPPFVGALSFILLFGRRGLVTSQLLGLDVSIYGWHGIWFAQTLSFFPLAYLVLVGVLRRVPTALEQAAAGYGASSWEVLRTVTLPLARPGILAATLFVSLGVLSDFGTPLLLGGRFRVLATEAYNRVTGWGDLQQGTALGLLLLVPALLLYALQLRSLAGERFATVGARLGHSEPPPAHWLVRAGLTLLCSAVSLVLLAKLAAIVTGGITKVWSYDYTLTLEHLNWALLRREDLLNTLQYSLLAAVLGTLVSLFAAFLVHGARVRGRTLLDLATLLPAAIPGTLLGIAYVLAFNRSPLKLTGSASIIIACMAVAALPTAYRICSASLQQVRQSLAEAAGSLGAGWLAVLRDITLPLLRGPLGSAWALVFIHSLGTLSAVIFLVSPGRGLASIAILNLAEEGYWGGAAAIATVLIALAALTLLLARLVFGRNFRPFEAL